MTIKTHPITLIRPLLLVVMLIWQAKVSAQNETPNPISQSSMNFETDKMKEFLKVIANYDQALELVKPGGSYDSLMETALTANLLKKARVEMKLRAAGLSAEKREDLESQKQNLEKDCDQILMGFKRLKSCRDELISLREEIVTYKRNYAVCIEIGDEEGANQALKRTIDGEGKTSVIIEKLEDGVMNPTQLSSPPSHEFLETARRLGALATNSGVPK